MTFDAQTAVHRERQIKAWTRQKRIDLIEATNPEWVDLAQEWFRADVRVPTA